MWSRSFAVALAWMAFAAPASAQVDDAFFRGIRTVKVEIQRFDDGSTSLDTALIESGIEGLLRDAGIQVSEQAADILRFTFMPLDRPPNRIRYFHLGLSFERTGTLFGGVLTRGRYPVPLTIWSRTVVASVGSALFLETVWANTRRMVGEFLSAHAAANQGYTGPAVASIRNDDAHRFRGVTTLGVRVNFDRSLPNAFDAEWVAAALRTRLAETGITVTRELTPHHVDIQVRSMDIGAEWFSLLTVEFNRPGFVALPETSAIYIGSLWAGRSLVTDGKLVFNLRGDTLDFLDALANEIKSGSGVSGPADTR